MNRRAIAVAGVWLAALCAPAASDDNNHSRSGAPHSGSGAQTASADARQRYEIRVAEDARPVTRAEAEPLLRGLGSPSPEIARLAVRALGRLERREFLGDVRRVLADGDPDVRAEAANAVAQIAGADPGSAPAAFDALRARVAAERHPVARAALLDALGRLPFPAAAPAPSATPPAGAPAAPGAKPEQSRASTPAPGSRAPASAPASTDTNPRAAAERILADALAAEFSPTGVRLGAARGLEMLLRRARGTAHAPRAETLAALRAAALGTSRTTTAGDETRVRRVAILALNAAAAADAAYLRLLRDRDDQIRRLAIVGVAGNAPSEHREALVAAGLSDPSPLVRLEALRVHARHLAAADCAPEITGLDDPDPHVALLAVDALGTACLSNAAATEALAAIVARPTTWAFHARAVVALARRAPDRARPMLARLAADGSWQARMYAARAAALLRDDAILTSLAADAHANVRAAAIDGLRDVAAHQADGVYLAALASPDYPVVLSVAKALERTPRRAEAAAALLECLAALTRDARDTSRDPRLAILDRLREAGDAGQAAALAPYTGDFDPRVAARAAEILTAWTGENVEIRTTRRTTLPAPSMEELDSLPPGLRVTMTDGGTFDIRLFTADAPIAVWRIVRLVKQSYYDGLTYHRILPGFIIQGGSPGADEFVGDGPFMRDELGLRSHDRGTVGVSTRGRDTGDAQWFINLVDNPRLDHEYTIFGEVVAGMEVVARIVEGDTMARVETLPRPESAATPREPQ